MKAYIIHIVTDPKKNINTNNLVQDLTTYGIDAEIFDGVPGNIAKELVVTNNLKLWPYNVKGQQIDNDDVDWHKLSRPGVIGCFLSHFQLWQKCKQLLEPIMIFEDDVKFYRSWIEVPWNDVLILSLGKKSWLRKPYRNYLEHPVGIPQAKPWRNRSMPGTSGYAINPCAAEKLINFYQGYYTASDNAINCDVCELQIHSHVMGRHMTRQEGNVSLTKKAW
jgi:GR25 family glycosyltransferase involved in LPS biosynthesis